MFDFKSIPEKPPRSVSLLSGLRYNAILNRSIIFSIIFLALFVGMLRLSRFLIFNGFGGQIGKNSSPHFILTVFPLFLILFFFLRLLPSLMQIKYARSIFKEGIITEGEIEFIGRKKPSAGLLRKSTNLEVFYSFTTLAGELIESKVITDNDWLANKLVLGSPVTVSYIEKMPKRSIILDFYYR